MQASPIPFRIWLYAMYKMSSARKGVSGSKLATEIGITQKSAWFMLRRIREACDNNGVKINGEVEIDDSYIGSKEKSNHSNKKLKARRGAVDKQAALGMKERGRQG